METGWHFPVDGATGAALNMWNEWAKSTAFKSEVDAFFTALAASVGENLPVADSLSIKAAKAGFPGLVGAAMGNGE